MASLSHAEVQARYRERHPERAKRCNRAATLKRRVPRGAHELERVITDGEPGGPVFYMNTTDLALMQHYGGEIPEDFHFRMVATDDLPEGQIALENVEDLSEEARRGLTDYWESTILYSHMYCQMEVEFAKRGFDEDDEDVITVLDPKAQRVAVLTRDELWDMLDSRDAA